MFEYSVCISLLLGFIVTLSIDDDYDVCKSSKCLWNKKGEGAIGKKVIVYHIRLWY